ncbi:MAG: DUF5040 domain-containing protein [Bacteroidales bacterium]|jgi:hypothetical protein|nr:DUF5040 domain-containing protein [Bacteroidales bacterium]
MKRGIFFLLVCLPFLQAFAQTKPVQPVKAAQYNILLSGASFASPENSWFETGCAMLNAHPVNRAIGGEAIANTANKMDLGVMYSKEELETLDAFVIMQVHNRDVADESGLAESYRDYKTPFTRVNYAAAFDYVIKRYISDCYELRNDPDSKYYGSKAGKPAVIVLCTDWHDARTVYNTSVRKLVEKWGFPLVEFDKNIGFSKNSLHPVTNDQYSLLYSSDTQVIDGVTYGWHPLRGDDSFIQQRMAAIFADLMRKILPARS